MKYKYTRYGDELRFNYCPICDKEKENPDFAINVAEGVYFCFSNNRGGRVEDLSKYGFDIGEIPELRKFIKRGSYIRKSYGDKKESGSYKVANKESKRESTINNIEEKGFVGVRKDNQEGGSYKVANKESKRESTINNIEENSFAGVRKESERDKKEGGSYKIANKESKRESSFNNIEENDFGGVRKESDKKEGGSYKVANKENKRETSFNNIEENSFAGVSKESESDKKEGVRKESGKDKDFSKNKKDIDLSSIFLARKNNFLNDEWIKYLESRCISSKYLKKIARVGKKNSMMIPLTNGEKVVGIKYRTLDKKIFSERGSQSNYLMNWQLVKDFKYIVIVEGEIDLLSALEVGFLNVVSLPFGAGNLKAIENQKEWLSKFEKIIIATDNDTQGNKSKDEIIKILSTVKGNKDKLYEVDMGEFKDFNEVLTSGLKDNLDKTNLNNFNNKGLETNQSIVTKQSNSNFENNSNDNNLDRTNLTNFNNNGLETNQLNITKQNNSNLENNSNDNNSDKTKLTNFNNNGLENNQSNVNKQSNNNLENNSNDNNLDKNNLNNFNNNGLETTQSIVTKQSNSNLENNSNDNNLDKNNLNNFNNRVLENKPINNQLNNANQIRQTLINLGKERLIKILENPIKINTSHSINKDIEEKISPFSKGKEGYYYNLTVKITDFLLDIRSFSDNYIFGVVITNGRERGFFARKTDLLTKNGILENLGYFLGSISLIPNFWSWILEENSEKYIPEIEHYGIIDDKYYDTKSDIICGKVDLKIKPISEIKDFTYEEKNWCDENIFGLRKDTNQSILAICWALGRFHIEGTYPILEVSGTTSIGKTEFIEFISRIMFGTKENIKSLATLSNHQIRSLSSCSNITPWAIDEIKITSRYQKEKAVDLYSTIRSVYDNKTINQGNITSKLTEFKLCTPLIISGESEIQDVSIKNRTISIDLNQKNKSSTDIFAKFKNGEYLEKFGKLALEDRLAKGKIVLPDWEVKNKLSEVTDDRQVYNGMCILTGLKALERVMPFNGDLEDSFLRFLNKKLSDHYTPTVNFLELLELVRDSGKEISHFYQIKGNRHFVRFSMLYKAIREEWEQTNSTLELMDMKTLKKQLIEEKFILNDRVPVRFPKNEFTMERVMTRACEIEKNTIFVKEFFDEDI